MKAPVKIPLRFAPLLEVHKSFLVRLNQGKRRLSIEKAMKVVDLFKAEGMDIDILQVLPDLEILIPYLCRCSRAKGR
jgi:hypothetical protein